MPGSVIHVYHEPEAAALAELVRAAAPERTIVELATREALREALPEIEILVAPTPPRDGWAGAAKLRLIQMFGAGVDQLVPSPDLPPAVEVAGARGVFAGEVAEHALAMILAHSRALGHWREQQRAHRFAPTPVRTLAGAELAIVGFGAVGQRVARAALALDMRVRAISRTGVRRALRSDVSAVELFPFEQLAGAVVTAEYIVIAAPLTFSTKNLFDAALIAQLRRDAYLIDVGRGGIVDEAALAAALGGGHLSGAALDVFTMEPLPPLSPLWDAPRLSITPHVAGLGERYLERCIAVLLDNVAALEAGSPRTGVIDRDSGY